MNLKVSGLGAEPKKVILLSVLGLILVGVFLYNRSSSPSSGAPVTPPPATTSESAPLTNPRVPTREVSRMNRPGQSHRQRNSEEFKPSLKPKKDEENIDRSGIDPTLRLDLLAKLKNVKVEGTTRSLFDFGTVPPPAAIKVPEPGKILVARAFVGPRPEPPEVDPAAVPKPPPPPVPLKFYGFVNQNKAGVKRAFFLDGDDIIVASEGQLIKNRYKIVRIGVNSAVVADTQFDNHESTLPLVEEING